jgi:hypothetical protein
MQRSGPAAVTGMTSHQRAPAFLVKWVEAERLLREPDCLAERPILLEQVDETRKHVSCTLAETFPFGIDPLAGTAGKDVARIQASSPVQGLTIPRQATLGVSFEGHDIHSRAGVPPRQHPRASVDQSLQRGPRAFEVVQFPAEVGQRLRIARFRPE